MTKNDEFDQPSRSNSSSRLVASEEALEAAIYTNGMCSIQGAFTRDWATQVARDHQVIMNEALEYPERIISRGTRRFYHAVHPERISGFVELATYPVLASLCESILGPDYIFVELGFDVPLPGAKNQPWHRDFRTPQETKMDHKLTSLVINLTTVDVTEDMGAFEISFGTQWDDGELFKDGMFPPSSLYAHYERNAKRCYPQLGDVSCRTGLAIHRGTEHNAKVPRPVLVLGAVAKLIAKDNPHSLMMTEQFYRTLPPSLQSRVNAQLVDTLVPIYQRHEIEDLRY